MSDKFTPLDPDAQLGYVLVRAADQVSRPWHAALRAHGINPRQFSVLAWLARDPGLSQGELARRVMVTPQNVPAIDVTSRASIQYDPPMPRAIARSVSWSTSFASSGSRHIFIPKP